MKHLPYLSQIYHMTIYNMKARYRKTIAGFVWVVLNPIIMYTVQAYIFQHILKIDVPNYFVFLLSGLLPWLFITQSLEMCVPEIQSQGELIKSLDIPPSILIFSQLLDNFINFTFTFIIIFIPMLFMGNINHSNLWLLPLSLIMLILTTAVAVYILSIVQVFYRDTKFIMHFITSIMLFLTPIFYPLSRIPDHLQWLVGLNPFYIAIRHVRILFYSYDHANYFTAIFINFIFLIIISLIGHRFIKRRYNEIYLLL